MKRFSLCCLLLLALSLSGCARYPDRADDGTLWDKDWEMMGAAMGVEGLRCSTMSPCWRRTTPITRRG